MAPRRLWRPTTTLPSRCTAESSQRLISNILTTLAIIALAARYLSLEQDCTLSSNCAAGPSLPTHRPWWGPAFLSGRGGPFAQSPLAARKGNCSYLAAAAETQGAAVGTI